MIEWWINFARGMLKLPEGDPSIPGNPTEVRRWNPDSAYLRYSLIGFWIGSVVMAPIILGLLSGGVIVMAVGGQELEALPAALIGIGLIFVGLFLAAVMAFNYATIHLELDMLRYTLTNQAVRLRRGVMLVEEVTLSYVNIQNVKFSQGPIQRYFGIADLFVETAGGGAVMNPQQQNQAMLGHRGLIKGISKPNELRDLILERVRQAKGAGLGDDGDDHDDDHPGSIDSPAGHSLLKEIRDTLADLNKDLSS